jgi:hypothetical protein
MYRIFSYPKTYHKCNTVYLRVMRRQCEAIKNIVKCLKSMRRQCEAIKNTVKCLLDPINILNSSSRYEASQVWMNATFIPQGQQSLV